MTKDKASTDDQEPVDPRELLAKHRMIGIVWCIQDVQAVRPDLTDDQAWEVLQEVEHRHDADLGISWTTLEIFADERFPKSDSNRRQP